MKCECGGVLSKNLNKAKDLSKKTFNEWYYPLQVDIKKREHV
jgi:hypothetical protein